MKASHLLRQFIPVAIISFAMMAPSFEVSAQNNRNRNKSEKNNDSKEYRYNPSSQSKHSVGGNNGRKADKKYYKEYQSGHEKGTYQYSQHYSKKTYPSHKGYFNHPKYGRVYQRFEHKPTIFRHSHGNYYYSQDQFYTYHDGIGYCVADPPRHVYFRDLPSNYSRVHVNGQVYFRNGDIYFSHSPRGYVMVQPPLAINLSVRF